MGSRWPVVQLREVCAVNPSKRGKSFPFDEMLYVDISAVGTGVFDAPPQRVSVAEAPSRAQRLVSAGDTIVATVRPNRRAFMYMRDPEPATVVSTGFAVLRAGRQLNDRYLYYSVINPRFTEWLVSRAKGSAYPAVVAKDFEDATIPLPPLDEQERIAGVLAALDDKIELNRQMAETLDGIAQTLFRKCFVEPAGRAWPSGGEALPEGWKVERLGEHLDAVRGLSYSGAGLTDDADGLPMHNLNSIQAGGGYKPSGLKRYQGDYRDRHAVVAGELLLANTDLTQNMEVIGSPALVPRAFGDKSLFSHHLYRVRPKTRSPLMTTYLYWLFRDPRMHRVLAGFTNGTTVNMLPLDGLEMPRVLIPPADLIEEFTNTVAPMQELRECLESENETLREIRDALLPPLLDGRIEVPATQDEEGS